MDWIAFLSSKSECWRLTPDQTEVFKARLAEGNKKVSEANIATQLNLGVAAVKKHMNVVYRCAADEFPTLKDVPGRGKLTELRACLKQAWKAADSADPLANRPATVEPDSGQQKSPLKPGAPFPRVRLPENFVPRPDVLNAVKQKLLAEDDRTLVVSAISGLGGLGKSVLAAALVLDPDVQARFSNGILWVTLGQTPDLQTMLGEWIRELDKSREAFSANTLESASRYLESLLAERQMLLVVDDVWNAAHADWFRVGGAGCRVLVTTREAQIEGADDYPLDLMAEAEALDLVRKKLGHQWREEQAEEVKAFAKLLGYLPLALNLAANQVQDGLSWAELRAEFEVERRAVALEVLNLSEAWERLDEGQQRKYSLRACFNLSLRRLQPEQLRQFSWLGVLPEDVNLTAAVAAVLWDLPLLQTKKRLIDLRRRSFLTDGVTTGEGEPTYRVHDLMHDMARCLIETGTLGAEIQNLALAHRQFLERYRERAASNRWDKLPNDGYIHRHLTWHMEQANWHNEIHALMTMSDELGRNAWFEACDRIGQPAIFVEDVARGWRIAEQEYEQDYTKSIVLQCRYALIMATLNSLASKLPVDLMAEFVKRGFWTAEQAWAYVEQMQDEEKIADAIKALAPYLPRSLFQVAVDKTRNIQAASSRAGVLSSLAKMDGADLTALFQAARAIQDEGHRAGILRDLAQTDRAYFLEALQAAQLIKNEYNRAGVLRDLAQMDGANFSALFQAARAIQDEGHRAGVLRDLAQMDGANFSALFRAAQLIKNEYNRESVLCSLAKIDGADLTALLQAVRAIQDEHSRAWQLSYLAQTDRAYFLEALQVAQLIQNEGNRVGVLCSLAKIDGADLTALLQAARAIQDEDNRANALRCLAQMDRAYLLEALQAAQSIQDEDNRANALRCLAQMDRAYLLEALQAARAIQDEHSRAWVLMGLAQMDRAYLLEALQAAQSIQDEGHRVRVLYSLAQMDKACFLEALQAAQSIQDEQVLFGLAHMDMDGADFSALLQAAQLLQSEYNRATVLSSLAQIDGADLTALLQAARAIQDEDSRARALSSLARIDKAYFSEALQAARAVQDEYSRAWQLRDLAQMDRTYFLEALQAAQLIQDEGHRVRVLCSLAKIDGVDLTALFQAARAIQDEHSRVQALRNLAQMDRTYFLEALQAAQLLQSEYNRATVLSSLAQIDGADLTALFQAARAIQNEHNRATVLCSLAQIDKAYFSEALQAAHATIKNPFVYRNMLWNRTRIVPQHSLPDIEQSILAISQKNHLHLLASRKRADLMPDLAMLYPAIRQLGGEAAMRGVVEAMQEVCSQWP